jgi:hippurate hydrolase
MADLSELLESAHKIQPQVVDLRRRIHQEPELGLELPATRAKVLEALDGLDLEIELSQATSGVVANLRGARPGRTILLRGDMDALPMPEDTDLPFKSRTDGAMHACGHDSHVAMLAGAARVLAGRRDEIAGNVRFMFQPGEEGHAGALRMIEEGVLDGVDGAFAIHISPLIPIGMAASRRGAALASADVFSIDVRGRGGHASMPQHAHDPVPVACEIVQAFQTLVTRRIDAFEPVVLTVTRIIAGTTTNVIPETCTIQGTLRAVSERSRKIAHEGIRRVATKIAAAHEVGAEVHLIEGYPVTRNDDGFASFVLGVGEELLGDGHTVEMPAPVMGAEDFSYVLERVPGAMAFLGVRPEGVEHPANCHSNRMLMNEDGMPYGIALYSSVAMRFLEG